MTNNELIAEFMGIEMNDNGVINKDPMFSAMEGCLVPLQFHSSWDWLMPVIAKIRGLNKDPNVIPVVENVNYNIGNDFLIEVYKDEPITFSSDREDFDNDIAMVYQSVVSFINWYNESKK